MQFAFRSTEFAKRVAKRLKKALPELKLMQAQEMVARLFGYANWLEFHRTCDVHRQDGDLRVLSADEMVAQAGDVLAARLSSETGMTREAVRELLYSILRVHTE